MASSKREKGESSNTKTDKPGILNQLASIMFCYRPTTEDTARNEDTQARQTNRNLATYEVLPGHVDLLRTFERPNGVFRSMATGKDGILYTGAESTNIRYWNRGNAAGGFSAEKGPNYALLFDRTGAGHIYVGSGDGKVRVFGVGSKGPHSFIRLEDLPWLENRRKKKIWKKKTKVLGWSKRKNWQSFPVTCMSFSEVGEDTPTYLYTGSTDCSVKVWNLKDSVIVDCLKEHKKIVGAVAAGCDGRMFSASQDGFLRMWLRKEKGTGTNDVSHTVVDTLLSGPVSVNALFLKSTTTGFATEAGHSELYAGLSDGRVLVWKEIFNFSTSNMETLRRHEDAVACIAGSPGRLVFSGARDGMICGWSNDGGTEHTLKFVLSTMGGLVHCIAAQEDWEKNDDGIWSTCILYTGSEDKTLFTWRIWCIA